VPDERLNDAQRDGVAHDDGPLLVLAGPGTGKTRVITSRIARIIDDGAAPESILAITFTIKAAAQMRARLCDLIGVSRAERVVAGTIHAFGMRTLQRFADLAGLAHEPTLIDSAQRTRLMRALVAEEPLGVELGALGWNAVIEHAESWISRFRNGALTPADVASAIDERRAWLEAGPEDLDDVALDGERAALDRLALAARLYGRFDATCRERSWLTLDDLITRPIDLLRENELVRRILHAEVRHVVVDEFQDVNAGQIELLRHVAPPASNPDLCVVGDDDQAIYMFRGADDRALAHFSSIWSGHATVRLSDNYRSAEPVIDAAGAVISRAANRYAPDKIIRAAADLDPPGADAEPSVVEGVFLESERDEPAVIAAMILEARLANPDRPWHDYGVIARTHLDLDRIADALALEDIPFVRSRQSSAADDDAVQDVLCWIRLLVAPHDTSAAIRLLRRPPLSMAPEQVAATMRDFAGVQKSGTTLVDWLSATKRPDGAMARFLDVHAELVSRTVGTQADDAIFAIMDRIDPVNADLLTGRPLAQRVESLVTLLRFARDKTARLDPPADLAGFWSYYQDLDRAEQALELTGRQSIDRDDDEELSTGAVQLLTAFAAKGLEFDTVFVPRVAPGHGYPKRGVDSDDDLPAWMMRFEASESTYAERRLDEERRIFYVACTRAIRRLVLLSRRTKSRSKSTHYFQELVFDEPDLIVTRDAKDILEAAETHAAEREAATLGLVDRARAQIERVRREARADAARALHEADDPALTEGALDDIASRMRAAAARMGVAASLGRKQPVPPWLAGAPDRTREWADTLAARLSDATTMDEPRLTFPALTSPLSLSYSVIDACERCPLCFYLHHELRLSEAPTDHQLLGNVVHQTLQWHYERHREADAQGGARPTTDQVLAKGRALLASLTDPRRPPGPDVLGRTESQLALAMDRLDDPGADVLCVEQFVKFEYEHRDATHHMLAKLDRIDRVGDAFRIIDYKTGAPRSALREPKKDDLQLAIYAMALAHLFPGDEPPRGVAEFWILATGERGFIDLASLDMDKTRKRIGAVIDLLLAGNFERTHDCSGPCAFFAPR
jgi:DNA helicase-2/ATP-dependent DNA helicase PcrA